MNTSNLPTTQPRRERRRPQISCTECRRRKQKCNFRRDGPCTNCTRRYPPVECYVQELGSRDTDASRAPPKKRNAGDPTPLNADSSRTETPPLRQVENIPVVRTKYPSIPLSRILQPVSETTQYPSPHAKLTTSYNSHGFSVTIASTSEDEEDVITQQRRKFRHAKSDEDMHKSIVTGGGPRPISGTLQMLNSFNDFPINTSLKNAELFKFYHHYVAPRLCSVDGKGLHPLFEQEILPWQIKSPLMPNVAILMASATQSYLQDPKSEMSSETLVIKAHVLALVNKFIRQDFLVVGHQALRIVIHLVIIEWWWGSSDALWPHMEGIRQMLELRGGLENMKDPLNMHVLIVTDYELACGFERDPYLQSTEEALAAPLPIPETYPKKFRCPLMKYPTTFRDSREPLNLSLAAAEILDDIRSLTISITSTILDPEGSENVKTSQILSAAAWIHRQILSTLPTPIMPSTPLNLIVHDTIILAAQIYTSAISTLTPFSNSFPSPLQERFYTNLSLVPLSHWSTIPGIFFWILLVATPASDGDYRGRFLRKQMACTGMSISLEDFLLGTAYLRSFWCVQLWIRREREKLMAAGVDEVVV